MEDFFQNLWPSQNIRTLLSLYASCVETSRLKNTKMIKIFDQYLNQRSKLMFYFFWFFRCDGESFCDIEVNSGVFGDPCPNTHKYVEVHYACSSQFGRGATGLDRTTKKLPPWFLQGSAGSLWTSETVDSSDPALNSGIERGLNNRVPQKPTARKPILGMNLWLFLPPLIRFPLMWFPKLQKR